VPASLCRCGSQRAIKCQTDNDRVVWARVKGYAEFLCGFRATRDGGWRQGSLPSGARAGDGAPVRPILKITKSCNFDMDLARKAKAD